MTRSKEAQDTSGRTRLTEKASLARHIREARIERARQGREGRGRGRGRGGRYTLERSPQPGPRLNAQGEPRQSDRVAQGDTYIPAYATRGRSRYPSRPVFRHDQGQRSEYRERSPLSDHSRRRQYYERTESYRRGDRGGHTSLPLPSRQESFQLRAEPRRHGRSRSPFRIRQERYQQRSKFHHESRSQSPVQYIREDRYEQHQMSSQFNEPVRSRYRAQRHLISEYTGIGVQSQNAPYAHQNPYLHERITGITSIKLTVVRDIKAMDALPHLQSLFKTPNMRHFLHPKTVPIEKIRNPVIVEIHQQQKQLQFIRTEPLSFETTNTK